MPPHQRHVLDQGMPQGQPQKLSPKGQGVFSKVNDDIRALNSGIMIISQKIKFLVRNEKILGRNLLVMNRKIKDLQESRQQGMDGGFPGMENELAQMNARISESSEKLATLQSEVENIRQNYATAEQLAEMKYVIDSINPLEFATLKDLAEATGGGRTAAKGRKGH